jgi:hypothetical protein
MFPSVPALIAQENITNACDEPFSINPEPTTSCPRGHTNTLQRQSLLRLHRFFAARQGICCRAATVTALCGMHVPPLRRDLMSELWLVLREDRALFPIRPCPDFPR